MTDLFLSIFNMSLVASYVALAVILARFLLKRAPKLFSYILWAAVLIRLVIPVSFTSSFSLLQFVQPQTTGGNDYMTFVSPKNPVVDAGFREITRFVHSSLPAAAPIAGTNLMQLVIGIGSIVWITGAAIILLYHVMLYVKVQGRVRTATRVKDNVYETDQIATPFVCGFWKPKIYIPTGIREHELPYILLHEQTHIRRRDHLIKPFAFLMLIIHWFNPLMWVSYALMSKDMEMSCDESVLTKLGHQIKGSYSTTLLSLSIGRSGALTGSPLAFGESHVKARIKNILSYRQPSSWIYGCMMLIIAALVAACTTNPKPLIEPPRPSSQQVYSGYQLDTLMKNKTLYVGNAGKVGGLISGMPRPEDLESKGIELQTTSRPYGVTIHYIMNVPTDLNNAVFYRNSIMLLSLIDNVGWITYSIVDQTGQPNGETHRFTVTREQADERLEEDVRNYSADESSLRQLIDRLED